MTTNLLHIWQQILRRPARYFPIVHCYALATAVSHDVDGRAAAQNTASENIHLPPPELGLAHPLVGQDPRSARNDIGEPKEGVADGLIVHVVLATFNYQDGQFGVSVAEPRGQNTASSAT